MVRAQFAQRVRMQLDILLVVRFIDFSKYAYVYERHAYVREQHLMHDRGARLFQ